MYLLVRTIRLSGSNHPLYSVQRTQSLLTGSHLPSGFCYQVISYGVALHISFSLIFISAISVFSAVNSYTMNKSCHHSAFDFSQDISGESSSPVLNAPDRYLFHAQTSHLTHYGLVSRMGPPSIIGKRHILTIH